LSFFFSLQNYRYASVSLELFLLTSLSPAHNIPLFRFSVPSFAVSATTISPAAGFTKLYNSNATLKLFCCSAAQSRTSVFNYHYFWLFHCWVYDSLYFLVVLLLEVTWKLRSIFKWFVSRVFTFFIEVGRRFVLVCSLWDYLREV
jgi:hypothetical protein